MKRVFLISVFWVVASIASAENRTLPTYYPAPAGSYKTLQANLFKLKPYMITTLPSTCQSGQIIYFNQNKDFYGCRKGVWSRLMGVSFIAQNSGSLSSANATFDAYGNGTFPDKTVSGPGLLVATLNWDGEHKTMSEIGYANIGTQIFLDGTQIAGNSNIRDMNISEYEIKSSATAVVHLPASSYTLKATTSQDGVDVTTDTIKFDYVVLPE